MGGLGTHLSANGTCRSPAASLCRTPPAAFLGRYYDAIVCRTYKQTTLDAMAHCIAACR